MQWSSFGFGSGYCRAVVVYHSDNLLSKFDRYWSELETPSCNSHTTRGCYCQTASPRERHSPGTKHIIDIIQSHCTNICSTVYLFTNIATPYMGLKRTSLSYAFLRSIGPSSSSTSSTTGVGARRFSIFLSTGAAGLTTGCIVLLV